MHVYFNRMSKKMKQLARNFLQSKSRSSNEDDLFKGCSSDSRRRKELLSAIVADFPGRAIAVQADEVTIS